ncbi:MAG: HAD hydrolase family protein [Ruminococcus sp.]|nr:HAD hydrolase family protein [Ruminococcus sp.]
MLLCAQKLFVCTEVIFLKKLPPVGQRIIKSSAAVLVCYIIYILSGERGIPFYSIIAALQCIQPYTYQSIKIGIQRMTGTLFGALFGLIAILLQLYIFHNYSNLSGYILNALFVIPVIYTTVLLDKKNASYISCVVYLSIAVNHMTDSNPFIFVFNRVMETLIGIFVGIAVNKAHLPRKKIRDCLFAAGFDDMLSPIKDELTPYSHIEMNRMIADGMNLTISTSRTPASVIKLIDGINLKFPIIVMDGAALYDIAENTFINAYVISPDSSREIAEKIRSRNMNCFINALCDDTLTIFYSNLENDAEKDMFLTLRRSPYRSYIQREPSEYERTVYIMAIDRTEKIRGFYDEMINEEFDRRFKLIYYVSDKYDGYSCIKIYNRNANTANMLRYLMEVRDIDKKITIGADSRNDIITDSMDINGIVRELKKAFEPVINPFSEFLKGR